MIIGEHDRALRSVIGRSTRRTARKVVGDPALVQSRGSAVGDAHPAAGVLPRPIVGEAAGDGHAIQNAVEVGCARRGALDDGVAVVGGGVLRSDVAGEDRDVGGGIAQVEVAWAFGSCKAAVDLDVGFHVKECGAIEGSSGWIVGALIGAAHDAPRRWSRGSRFRQADDHSHT